MASEKNKNFFISWESSCLSEHRELLLVSQEELTESELRKKLADVIADAIAEGYENPDWFDGPVSWDFLSLEVPDEIFERHGLSSLWRKTTGEYYVIFASSYNKIA